MKKLDRPRPDTDDGAYTGETIVMPRRRSEHAPTPRLPRSSPQRIWPAIRLALLLIAAVLVVGLLLAYFQVRALAGEVVQRDVRPNPPIASPLGKFNLLIVGVDARPGHPEEGARGDTLM
ncbi:MAG TPA: hypothetical protein VFX76_13550, partial [Roseiflexaceae bacterium]|nr:hypothetical protein [Roseiflexaceae bacterium]